MAFKRDYEVSIWTLQDSFITVLKPSNIERKGMIENKKFDLKLGEDINKYEFSIPMYIRDNGQRIENPIWYNTINGNIIANMRKVKVILNKGTDIEAIYEFLIVDVSQRHEQDQLYCDVSCEDLAFHELGKVGFKISLSSEVFEEEYKEWFDTDGTPEHEPLQTLQYWNKTFLTDINDVQNPEWNVWYYDIQMDWTSFEDSEHRDTHKVYEEAYANSWEVNEQTGKLVPVNGSIREYREKARPVNIEESNIFNITQQLAETFGVFCRYQYLYDDDYHIIGRRIIYYNNFLNEENGYMDITYPYTMSKIVRKNEGKDITTKMFVRPVSTEAASASGQITIMDAPANKSREDYLLNFDYMLQAGAIAQDQYNAVADYEVRIHQLNLQIEQLQNEKDSLNEKIVETKSNLATIEKSIPQDQNALNQANSLLNALDLKDGDADGYIHVTANNPDIGRLIKDLNSSTEIYYINISAQGIAPESLKMYRTFNSGNLNNEMTFTIVYDDVGAIVKLTNITKSASTDANTVYLTYKYSPKLQYEKVVEIYTIRLNKDLAEQQRLNQQLVNLQGLLNSCKENLETAESDKKNVISSFARLMGPALRESYWQPDDDYQSFGDKYIDSISFTTAYNSSNSGASGYTQWKWDTTAFDGEQKVTYELGVQQTVHTYPCIKLSDAILRQFNGHLDEISFLYYDYTAPISGYDITTIRNYSVNSQCQFGFLNINDVITPILILTFADTCSADELNMMHDSAYQPQLGILTTSVNETDHCVDMEITSSYPITSTDWVDWTDISSVASYPRIEINTLEIYNDSSSLSLKLNTGTLLENYKDYYLLTRENGKYYLTLRAQSLLENWNSNGNNELQFYFTVSNASTCIYLDALEVLRENAYPKVSYDIEPNIFPPTFVNDIYNKLNYIVNINDIDLKLVDIQGYISSLTLDLDSPQNDKIEIKNYKNKFEDLFTSIVAQTEAMQKNGYAVNLMSQGLTSSGTLTEDILQRSMRHANLEYAFNQGMLTIDEANGILGASDDGVVAFRGGGIFTATEKDENDNWIWNTGILPSGINADLITAGQLNTNLIKVYAGDKIRFQLNSDGLYAYKSVFDDSSIMELLQVSGAVTQNAQNAITNNASLDLKQYVVHNQNGLFLTAEDGAVIKTNNNEVDLLDLSQQSYNHIDRVEVSWNGFKLRNWENKEVFKADPDTGNLTLTGKLNATRINIGEDSSNPEDVTVTGGHLKFTGSSGIDMTSGGNITIGSNGKFTVDSDNFKINENGNVTITGAITATSLLVKDTGVGQFNELVQNTPIGALVQSKENVLNTMEFNADEGLRIRANSGDSYSTLTTSDGYYIQYNANTVASFTGDMTEVNNLAIGNIVVKKTGRQGWRWTKK